jgi:hypothetical protein
MVQFAKREASMEEIVVALRESRRNADRMHPLVVAGPSRGSRGPRAMIGSTDSTDLRDSEIERLLTENANLNARVISLLKVLEQEQASHAETAAETAPTEADRAEIHREVRAALEAELRPALLVLLRLVQKQFAESSPDDRNDGRKVRLPAAPSDWIVDLMHKLDDKAPAPNETVATGGSTARQPKMRQFMADVLNAFGVESHAAPPRPRFT